MSIKIIKEGSKKKKKDVYEATCEKCDCIFEYNIEDVESKDRDSYGKWCFIIKCPCCGHILFVPPTFKRYDFIE